MSYLIDPYDQQKTRWELVIFGLFIITVLGAYIGKFNASRSGSLRTELRNDGQGYSIIRDDGFFKDTKESCTRTPDGSCTFATQENLAKWKVYLESEIKRLEEETGKPTAILTKVCRKNGFTDSDCPKILYAMAVQESFFGKVMTGDSGRSHGYFHILDIHKLPKSCSHDLECSADWSLKRMIRYGFKTNRDKAVMAHNGTPGTKTTLNYLAQVKKKMSLF